MPPPLLATSPPCSISSATSATINPPRATTPGGKPTPRATTRARKQAVVRQHRTAALLRSQLADANVPEHHHLKLIVQLKPDRSRLRPLRIARMFGHYLAVQLDRDLVVPRDDVHRVPVVVVLSVLGRVHEAVDAARGMRVRIAVVDLDLIADLRRRLSVIRRRDDRPLGARAVADRDAAVPHRLDPIFQMQIELAEIVPLRIEPRLLVDPVPEIAGRRQRPAGYELRAQVRGSLPDQRAVGEHGPLAVADDLPAIEVLFVLKGVFIWGGEGVRRGHAGQGT